VTSGAGAVSCVRYETVKPRPSGVAPPGSAPAGLAAAKREKPSVLASAIGVSVQAGR
jgi:hypothetical protein